jgi:hypothetical protein
MPPPGKVIAPRGVGAGSASAMPSHPNQCGRLSCLTIASPEPSTISIAPRTNGMRSLL